MNMVDATTEHTGANGGADLGDHPPLPAGPLRLRFDMASDWYVGSGRGMPGGVDRTVQLDTSGLPYLPAKTVTGIWRDACERAALALDAGRADPSRGWASWVAHVFGAAPSGARRPHAARIAVSPARFPPEVRSVLTSPSGNDSGDSLRRSTRLIRASTRIDERGTAMKGTLRTIEVARKGASLWADVEPIVQGEQDDLGPYELAVLLAGTTLLERVGGKRRRGLGRCEVTLLDGENAVSMGRWADWIAERIDSDSVTPAPARLAIPDDPVDLTQTARSNADRATDWVRLHLRIRLDQPVAAQSFRRGNVLETHDFVPGTMLLGPVARLVSGVLGTDLRPRIAEGSFSVGNAVPVIGDQAATPAPLSLARLKDDPSARVIDRVRTIEESDRQYARFGPAWTRVDSGTMIAVDPEIVALTHNSIDDATQRPTQSTGGLFTRMALAPEMLLDCEVRVRSDVAAGTDLVAALQPLVGKLLRLGRSKKDDYGRAALVEVRGGETDSDGSADVPCASATATEATVTLRSDTILRDEWLRPTPNAEALVAALNEALCEAGGSGSVVTLSERTGSAALSATAIRRIESWQVQWGLPRPTIIALQAGSVVSIAVDTSASLQDLIAATAGGVGERRGEGFGRIVIEPHLEGTATSWGYLPGAASSSRLAPSTTTPPNGADAVFVRAVERAAWRDKIDDAVDDFVVHRASSLRPAPANNTQLGGLRSQVLAMSTEPGVAAEAERERVREWFEHLLAEGRGGWREFPFSDQITGMLADPERVWGSDLLGRSETWPTAITSREDLRGELATYASARLIGAVMAYLTAGSDRQAQQANDSEGRLERFGTEESA